MSRLKETLQQQIIKIKLNGLVELFGLDTVLILHLKDILQWQSVIIKPIMVELFTLLTDLMLNLKDTLQ